MAYMTWDNKYSVNVKDIDEQHKKLIDFINSLHDAMKKGEGKKQLSDTLSSMVDYAASHFSMEEKYMTQYNYPEYTKHKGEHREFIKKAMDFQKSYNSGKLALSVEVMNFLKDWLVNHIMKVDKKYSSFFNEKGIK